MRYNPASAHFSRAWLCTTSVDSVSTYLSRFVTGSAFYELGNLRTLPRFGEEQPLKLYPTFGTPYPTPVATQGSLHPLELELNYIVNTWRAGNSLFEAVRNNQRGILAIALADTQTAGMTRTNISNNYPMFFVKGHLGGLAVTPSLSDAVTVEFTLQPEEQWTFHYNMA